MPISITNFTGTATVGTTEYSMTNGATGVVADTTVGIFQAFVDFGYLVHADIYEFKVYEKALSGGTQRVAFYAQVVGNNANMPLFITPSVILGAGWDMTLKKLSGTDRGISWSIRGVT